jgi:hypothetical protein
MKGRWWISGLMFLWAGIGAAAEAETLTDPNVPDAEAAAGSDDDEEYDTDDEITVEDMMDAQVPADELVDDDGGANETAEAEAMTPSQAEADAIAEAYADDALGGDGVPLTAEEATVQLPAAAVDQALAADHDPSARSVLDPDTDLSRLREVLPGNEVDPKHGVVQVTPPPAAPQDPVTAAQTALIGRGFAVSVDGTLGKDTRTALKTYQRHAGLAATGRLDDATADSLGIKL